MPKIFINPGHCVDIEPGACGCGLEEAEVVLKIGKLVEKYLNAVGYDVRLLQADSLDEIVDAANYWDADIFVSIHCNAYNGSVNGTETYNYYGSERGKVLATCIHNRIKNSLPLHDRRVKESGFFVIRYTDMPAVLVETAFIDNAYDAEFLRNDYDAFARAIACGITDYFSENH